MIKKMLNQRNITFIDLDHGLVTSKMKKNNLKLVPQISPALNMLLQKFLSNVFFSNSAFQLFPFIATRNLQSVYLSRNM